MSELEFSAFLFVFSLLIGIIAPLSGVGGGVIFVPLLTAFSPLHVDYVRGAGIMVALTSALASSPTSMERGFTNLRIALPAVIVINIMSFIGGHLGLFITREFPEGKHYVVLALGLLLFFVLAVMVRTERVEFPEPGEPDKICRLFGMEGECYEPSLEETIHYRASHTLPALLMFAGVGLIAGMFGLGAGWANVPVLNLVMLLPIRVAVATSMLLIAINSSVVAWVYMSKGAVLPNVVVPAIFGMTIGSRIGAHLSLYVKPRIIRLAVLLIMLIAASSNVYKGVTGLWGI